MTGPADRYQWILCAGLSILCHIVLLIFGVTAVIQKAQVRVKAGETSIALNLIAEPPVATPHPPSLLPAPQLPKDLPAPVPEPVPLANLPLIKSIVVPAPSVAPPVKIPPRKISVKASTAVTKITSTASQGASQAQPDELQNEQPDYPEESRVAHEEGTVVLRVDITATGQATHLSILKSSGYFRLDQAARRAVQNWKFHPAHIGGMPVSSQTDVPIHFKLE